MEINLNNHLQCIAGIASLGRHHKITALHRQEITQYHLQTLHHRQIKDFAADYVPTGMREAV
jgi:hypothetical protein